MSTKLKLMRVERDLRQREVARALDINPVVLSKIENAWLRPNPVQRAKLARFYGLSEEELFSDFWGRGVHERKPHR